MSMELHKVEVKKYLTKACYHFYDDSRPQSYIGAVWQDDESGRWSAFCTVEPPLYGHLGNCFISEKSALECLERRAGGDAEAIGEYVYE